MSYVHGRLISSHLFKQGMKEARLFEAKRACTHQLLINLKAYSDK